MTCACGKIAMDGVRCRLGATHREPEMSSFDLDPVTMRELAAKIKRDVDAYSVKTLTDEHRNHLGASIIGHECKRYIWYAFRWVMFEVFNGRMLRLFERGHLEEARFIKNLRGIGFQVWELDPNTGEQFRIWGAKGHFGGAADSKGRTPYPELTEEILLEFKTHNKKSFDKLEKDGVQISKPRHYAQMCSYGVRFGYRYGVYCGVNKDDDDLYFELVKLDPRHADDLVRTAEDIIFSQTPPPKLSLQPEYWECKQCCFAGICHKAQPVQRNCRSCQMSQPVDGAAWYCHVYKQNIPQEYIKTGCADHYRSIV